MRDTRLQRRLAAEAAAEEVRPAGLVDLPPELYSFVLKNMPLLSTQRLASCSKTIDNIVKRSEIWRTLAFSKVDGRMIDDDGLKRLLKKVDAVSCMVEVNLQNTVQISRRGLEPLKKAHVLTKLDLRSGGPDGDDIQLSCMPEIHRRHISFLPLQKITSLVAQRDCGFEGETVCHYISQHAQHADSSTPRKKKKRPSTSKTHDCAYCTITVCKCCIQDKRDTIKARARQ
tara:strand:+ start:75 stop:761 length:687 start_codon:yes stop_codon:yes gene_type:complete